MEAESALEMQEEQGTVQTDRGQDGPPTSMNPGSFENYSQVIFPNINNSYPPKTDILCTFHKRNKFKSGTKDWIGIFKVGWQNTKEYYTWVSLSTSVDNQVLFKAYYLPKDDEDYQFCYVDQNGDVRGVSTPFQFTVNEDENEIVMVTTMKENQDMNEMLKTQKAELQSATEKITTLEKENMDLLCQVKSAEGEKEMLTRKQLELDMEVYKLRDFEKELKQKFEAENKQLQDLQIKVKNLEEENETWHRKNLESELLLNKVQNLERELNQKIKDLENIKAENKQLQSDNEAKQQAVENLSDLLDNCKKRSPK
ncbi:unnamed protein product [Staurois parvus]|uniref:SKICH domain-containing protein n=1 Tax=Staurois parvus TaxID=386267 RepID=A0ABN9EH82_9NEOB|nr:unnamed protein product [Staurois parvus]